MDESGFYDSANISLFDLFVIIKVVSAARYHAKFMGESGFYDTANISLFYQKIINMSLTFALSHKFCRVFCRA